MTRCFRFFIYLRVGGHFGLKRGPPLQNQRSLVGENLLIVPKIGRTATLALITKMYHANFLINRMSSQGARASSVLSTPSCFSSFEKWYRLLYGLNGIKGSILVWTNHINYEKCIEQWFLAPWVYLCSTSLTWCKSEKRTQETILGSWPARTLESGLSIENYNGK